MGDDADSSGWGHTGSPGWHVGLVGNADGFGLTATIGSDETILTTIVVY